MSYEWLNFVLPFADTAAPVGGYAHSYGLEGCVQDGVVTDVESLRLFLLRDVFTSLQKVDVPLMLQALHSLNQRDWKRLQELDRSAWALRPTRQLRESSSKVGRQQWRLYKKTWGKTASDSIETVFITFQAPVVAGVVFGLREVPAEAATRILCYQTYSALLQSVLKLLAIGPMAVQELLHEAMSHLELHRDSMVDLPEEEWGAFNPLWDIASSRHERVEARLFLS